MKKEISEHTKELRKKTANEWHKRNTIYNFNIKLRDVEAVKIAKEIENKTEFLINALKSYKKHA
jgi:hypothetical protein